MTLATEAEADREFARNVGYQRQDRAWILSDRDCWYPNPFYSGPPVPHPEEETISPEEAQALLAECNAADEAEQEHAGTKPDPLVGADWDRDNDIPF